MKKLLGFILLCIPLYVWGDNLIFNHGFDMTPWDTGWTIESNGSYGKGEASRDTTYHSPPQSCKLSASAYASLDGSYGMVYIYQEIIPAISCTCIVYLQNEFASGEGNTQILVKINGEWVKEWESNGDNPSWTKWWKTYNPSDTVEGIKFYAVAWGLLNSAFAWFWIDDVYISGEEVGVEEDSRLQIANCKVEISPNPFIQSTTIKYHLPANPSRHGTGRESKVSLEIYDITGRRVKTLVNEEKEAGNYNVSFDARGLSAGIYFAKLVAGDFKKTKKLTILK